MEKTANYQLPQWVKEDAIKMEDFNAAFGTLDGALKANADAIAGKAGSDEVGAVQREVAAEREANCLVKLAGPIVTAADNAEMNFDLSQVDMSKVAALFFTFSAAAGLGDMTLSANGSTVATVCSNNSSTSAGIAWLVPMNGKVACFVTNAINKGGMPMNQSGTCETVTWESINTLTFSGSSYAGATATLFAVRK